jgi:hypothetical protein
LWNPALQAFKSYDEAGAARRIQCLKYLVLATMLMESAVDPFDAQEAAPYKQDPEVLAMTNLVAAYQENNIKGFERILRTNKCALQPYRLPLRTPLCLRICKCSSRAQVAWESAGWGDRCRVHPGVAVDRYTLVQADHL